MKVDPETIQTKTGQSISIQELSEEQLPTWVAFFENADQRDPVEYEQLVIGAFDEKKLIGYLKFYIPHPHDPTSKHIGAFNVTILEEYRNQGIASILLRKAEHYAKNQRIVKLETKLRTNNLPGMIFCKKNGFTIEGVRTKAVFINGQYQDEFFMAKIL